MNKQLTAEEIEAAKRAALENQKPVACPACGTTGRWMVDFMAGSAEASGKETSLRVYHCTAPTDDGPCGEEWVE